MSYGLRLIELAKIIGDKMESFQEMSAEIMKRHVPDESDTLAAASAEAAIEKDRAELLAQIVTLPGPRFPRAILSEAKLCADDWENMLWLFEPTPESGTA